MRGPSGWIEVSRLAILRGRIRATEHDLNVLDSLRNHAHDPAFACETRLVATSTLSVSARKRGFKTVWVAPQRAGNRTMYSSEGTL